MADNFKVVYIKSTQEVEPIPHQWEENGTVYWPPTKGQVRQQQSNAGSIPDKKTWKKYDCVVKASNILLYMHASAQADQICALEDSSSDYSTTDDEKGKIVPSKSLSTSNKRTSVLKKNISGLPAYDFNFNKQKTVEKPIEHQCVTQDSETLTSTTISVSSDVGISESDENTFVNDSDVLEKLSILESKVDKLTKDLKECKEKIVEKIVEKCADISVRLDNLDTILKKTESTLIITENGLQIFPIDRVPALEKLEKDLEDKAYKKNVFAHLTRCIGSALPSKTACYKLAGIMFTKQLLTKYSWTGMSRSLEKKAFNRLTGILDIFYNVVFKSDNSFTYPGRDSFFRDCILKHSNTRLKLNKKVKAPAETQETKENEENQNPVTETQEEPQANEETINSVDSDKEELYEYFVVEEDGELTKTHQ